MYKLYTCIDYTYLYIHMYIHVCIYMYICVCIYMNIHILNIICVCMYICIYTCVYMHIYMYVYILIIYICIYQNINTYIYYIHIRRSRLQSRSKIKTRTETHERKTPSKMRLPRQWWIRYICIQYKHAYIFIYIVAFLKDATAKTVVDQVYMYIYKNMYI